RLPGHPLVPGDGDSGDDLHGQQERAREDAEPAADLAQHGTALLGREEAPGRGEDGDGERELPADPQGRGEDVQESDDGPPGHQVTSGKPCAPAAARRTSGNGGPLGGGGCSPRGGWAARRGGRRSGRSSLTLTAAGCVTPGPVVIRQGDEAL